MEPFSETTPAACRASLFTAQDVRRIAGTRGWLPQQEVSLRQTPTEEAQQAWMAEAAQLLGAQVADAGMLEALLERIFRYDARASLALPENQAVMSREGAREVLRELARLVLASGEVNSDRYKEIVAALKERTGRRGQELFHPVRLALAGSAGEGELDRVILLLDGAAQLDWGVEVKGCRQRVLEFCGAID